MEDKQRIISFLMPASMADAALERANALGISRSALIRALIRDELRNAGGRND